MNRAAIWLKDHVQRLKAMRKGAQVAPHDPPAKAGERRRDDRDPTSIMSLDQAMNCIADPVFVKDQRHRLVLVNDAQCALAGRSRDELLGRTDAGILPKEQRELFWQQDDRVIETGLESVSEDQIPDAQGIVRTMITRKARFIDSAGNPFVVGVIRDITERRQAENALRRSEERLRVAQKMEAVGRLAAGVAHDFNNMLAAIMGNADLMKRGLDPDHPAYAKAEDILKAATRSASLTRQLLAYSRQQVLQPKVLDLNAIVAEIESMLRHLLGEHIEVKAMLESALGRVMADPSQVEQVLMNLAVNARDAMPQGGKLTIETANRDLDANYMTGRGSTFQPGPYVLLAVSDTGCGMDAKTRARVFEPFFTTKGPGQGTGLGLSTVYGIVKQSGGYIDIYSEPGRGTAVQVYLPRVDGALVPVHRAHDAPGRGTETVLLAEDEALVRKVVRETLVSAGYSVLEASSAREAEALSASHQGPIDLLVTDMVMPGPSGRELAALIVERRPSIAVLCISGYAGQAIVHHEMLDPGTPFLQKPFTMDALLRRVREVLDGPSRQAA